MALAREAFRIATVRALRGRTWGKVRDSEQGAIEDAAADAAEPVVAVYTDDGDIGTGIDGFLTNGTQSLLIEIAMTARMKVEGEPDEVVQPATDAALELAVGLIERQVLAALSDPTNEWAALWKRFILKYGESRSVRGTMMREGVRFAGRQLQFSVTLIRDPLPGDEIAAGSVWADFLAALEAASDTAAIAESFRAVIAGNAAGWSEAQRALARLALTPAEGRALHMLAPDDLEGDEVFAPLPAIYEVPPEEPGT